MSRVVALLCALFPMACAHAPAPVLSPHYVLGGPYQADGVWRYPRESYDAVVTGLAMVYPDGHPPLTTDGEAFDQTTLAAAHPTLQLPAIARVTDLDTGRQVTVRINDRGPATLHRLIEVTSRTAQLLGFPASGVARVRLHVLPAESQAAADVLPGAPGLVVAAAPRVAVAEQQLSASPGVNPDGAAPPTPLPQLVPASLPTAPPMRLPEIVTATAPDAGSLWVELGSFLGYRYAAVQRARLAALDPQIVRGDTAGQQEFRVRLGPFATISEADAALDRAIAAGVPDAAIIVEGDAEWGSRRVNRSLFMITRRSALLGSVLGTGLLFAARADAQRRPLQHGHPARPYPGKEVADQPPPSPADTPLGPVDTKAKWAFIQDFNTGAELLNKNADDQMPPSSMTKLMTIYLVYQRLKDGRLKLNDMLPVSEKAWHMGGSKMFVPLGGSVSVEDLIRGVVVQSGNDACIVLAEAISGSEQQFVELMNETAKKLGLTHTHYANCTGWPDPDQYMSSRDIAVLAADLIRAFPAYYHYDSEKSFKFNNIEQYNRNPMVQRGTADGLKTGHTEAGGYGLVASSLRNGRRVIVVLNGMDSMHERAEESERLVDWAFMNFENVTLFADGDAVDQAPVWLGTTRTVPLVGEHGVVVTMPRNWRQTAKIEVSFDSPVRAPIARGAVLGKLTVGGQGIPPQVDVPLVAGTDVPKLGLPARAVAVLVHYVSGS